jgi:hypothetical protein
LAGFVLSVPCRIFVLLAWSPPLDQMRHAAQPASTQWDAGTAMAGRHLGLQALMFGDLAYGMQGVSANLAGSLGNFIGHGEKLLGLFVDEQMIVTEMAATHVPVEILRL